MSTTRPARTVSSCHRAAWPPLWAADRVPVTASPTRIRFPRTTISDTCAVAPDSFARLYQAITCSRVWHGGDGSPGGPHRTLGSRTSLRAERSAVSNAALTWCATASTDSGCSVNWPGPPMLRNLSRSRPRQLAWPLPWRSGVPTAGQRRRQPRCAGPYQAWRACSRRSS